ncbi:HmuY family protein [Myxococcus sp. K15C18031901]|uniref:HmuY family protein n=1 Tax=Myxococcus dinghuensis TaxID=2906761 RepID=UPI0020A7C17E|nr:HmuY family protein [Myxococcus dinghuensis]MCP3100643.1 HmuY family protein [Myxococcus dinghuensis]
MMIQSDETMPRRSGQQGLWVLAAVAMSLVLLASCGDDDEPNDPSPDSGTQVDGGVTDSGTPDSGTGSEDGGTETDAGTGDGGTTPQTCGPSEVICKEQSIDKLDLLTVVSTGNMSEEGTTSGEFLSYVDARAGGLTPTMSYTYVRFTPQGLQRVQIDDQAALGSTEWDLAFRRYTMRVNSGTSGASCVSVAQTAEGTTFASVTSVDTAWTFNKEAWYDNACTFIADDVLGGALTQLGSYFRYEGCLAMTGKVFVIRLADGRHVKFEVVSYYEPSVQTACNDTGSLPSGTPSGSGQFRVKWAFLP